MGAFHDLLGVIWGRWHTVSCACCPDTPAPARPAVPVGDGRAGAGMGWRDMVSEGLGTSCHAGLLPLTPSGQSGTYARFVEVATMGVAGRFFAQLFGSTPCDFGTIARWGLDCTGSSSASGYPLPLLSRGFPFRVYPSARFPVASTLAQLPPAPLSGGAGGGELGGGDWGVLGYPSLDLAGGCRCG